MCLMMKAPVFSFQKHNKTNKRFLFIFLHILLFILLFYFTVLFLKNIIAHGCTVNEIFID